jgi:hypothetical protein
MSTISLIAGFLVAGDVALKSDGTPGVRSDTHGLQKPAIGFHANADGTVALEYPLGTGTSIVTLNVKDGSFYPYAVRKIRNTGTSLTNAQIELAYGPALCRGSPSRWGSRSGRGGGHLCPSSTRRASPTAPLISLQRTPTLRFPR